jgi:hypothetical protein
MGLIAAASVLLFAVTVRKRCDAMGVREVDQRNLLIEPRRYLPAAQIALK